MCFVLCSQRRQLARLLVTLRASAVNEAASASRGQRRFLSPWRQRGRRTDLPPSRRRCQSWKVIISPPQFQANILKMDPFLVNSAARQAAARCHDDGSTHLALIIFLLLVVL